MSLVLSTTKNANLHNSCTSLFAHIVGKDRVFFLVNYLKTCMFLLIGAIYTPPDYWPSIPNPSPIPSIHNLPEMFYF